MNNKVRVSVIIPTLGKKLDLLCLSIKSIINESPDEVIIVTKHNSKAIRDLIKKIIKNKNTKINVNVIEQKHKGLNGARLDGFNRSTGDIVIITDDDAQWTGNIIKSVIRDLRRYNLCGVGGVGITKDKKYKYKIGNTRSGFVNYLDGVLMAYKRECLHQIFNSKKMDLSIQPADDVILGEIATKILGYRLYIDNNIRVTHYEGTIKDNMVRRWFYGRGKFKLILWYIKHRIPISVGTIAVPLFYFAIIIETIIIVLYPKSISIVALLGTILIFSTLIGIRYKAKLSSIPILLFYNLLTFFGFIYEMLSLIFKVKK